MSTPPWGENPQQPTPPPPPPPAAYQPYAAPGSPYAFQPPQQTNGLAIASLVVSIGSVFLCCGVPGIAGAIMGHVARRQIREQGQAGDGMALGGVIVGWVAFVLGLAVVLVYVVGFVILGLWAESADCYTDSDGVYVCN